MLQLVGDLNSWLNEAALGYLHPDADHRDAGKKKTVPGTRLGRSFRPRNLLGFDSINDVENDDDDDDDDVDDRDNEIEDDSEHSCKMDHHGAAEDCGHQEEEEEEEFELVEPMVFDLVSWL